MAIAMGEPAVLHVLEALTTGCARHVLDLVEHVDGWDHHVAVPTRAKADRPDDAAIRDQLRALGATLHPVAMRRPPVDPRNVLAVLRLRRLAGAVGAEVVHGHSSIGGALARIAAVGGRPAVYTPNGIAAGRLARATERVLGPLTARFVAVSPSEAEEASRLRLVPPDRLTTVANAIDVRQPEPRSLHEELGIDPTTRLVGTVGRLAPQKAPEVFVAAMTSVAERVPDVEFVLIGDGPQAEEVRAAVATAGLAPRFHHRTYLAEASRYLPSLDVFVLTSRFEGGPYAPLEAMRAGVPVVLTDVVGSRDAVVDGEDGVLVPPEQPEAVAAAVVALLDDPARARDLGLRGRRTLEDRFDVRTMAAAYQALYRQMSGR